VDFETEQAVLAAVDDERIVAELRELVRIPSVDGTAAEVDVQAWCADRLEALGLTVDHWRLELSADEPGFPGMEVERTEAWGCVGVLGGDATPGLILNGHVDVVPGGTFDARIEDGVMWGRGTCDMKGGVAAVLGAVAAIVASGITLRKPLAVHTVIGEEDGGVGAFATLRRGHRGEACLIAEPTAGTVIPANAGSLTFRLEVPGLATHGSTRSRGSRPRCRSSNVSATGTRIHCSPTSTSPTRCPSAPSRPATGRAPSPTTWSPRVGTAYVSGRPSRTRGPPSRTR
jgi:acetylornithine deacetylase